MKKIAAFAVLAGAMLFAPAANAAIPSVFNGDVTCTVQGSGVRYCTGAPRSTTKTFDGTPIDVNVAFPPDPGAGDGNYPLIMMFHGYGGSKIPLSGMQPWLDRGYAVFSMTDRGFGESCGSAASRTADPAGCANGFIRLMDNRYEVRDAQFLSGRLVDAGLVSPTKIGAIGPSYGGGLSMALAALKDRTVMLDGSLVPWTSPNGTKMSLAAAAPNIPWTDLAYSLTPNGSTLDYVDDAPYQGRIGVEKLSLTTGLYNAGCSSNYCANPGQAPDADLKTWKPLLDAGEPYDGNPAAASIISEITKNHSSYYIDHSEAPAPIFISNGFTDDLFPVDEAVRYYNRTKDQYPDAPISMLFGDFGHPRAKNLKPDVAAAIFERSAEWFDHYVKGNGPAPFQGVEAFTQTCPLAAASGGPYFADNWAQIAPGEVRYDSKASQTILPGAAPNGDIFDPGFGPGSCASGPAADATSVANYRLPAAGNGGFTLMGSPTIDAKFTLPGANSQVAARLLDVAPDGSETLVARGLWRPVVSAKPVQQIFQLHPGGWHFADGHIPKLELSGSDQIYGRGSNDQQAVTVSDLSLRLPVVEKPGAQNSYIKAPGTKTIPKGYKVAAEFADVGKAGAGPAKGKLKVRGRKLRLRLSCPAAWEACRKGTIRVKASGKGKGGKFLVAKGRFNLLGGKTKKVNLKLKSRARKYFRHHNGLKVKVITGSSERLGLKTVTRRAKG